MPRTPPFELAAEGGPTLELSLMTLPPFGSVLTVRPEILDPRGLLDMVDLGLLTHRPRGLAGRAPSADVLRDPAAFFDITYPTAEIVEALRVLARRASAPESVPGTLLLTGRYGQGKSHVLLAAHHALNAPEVARAWASRWQLGALELPASPIVITRSFIQNADEPLWDMLLRQLTPAGGRKPKINDFPDGELIESLLGDRPIFLIMDELERWYDAQDDRSRSRNRNFLQALTEVSMRDGRLTVVTSVLGERQEPGDTIRRVRPLELSFRSAEDRQRVALFRLFSDRDSPAAHAAATQVADAYLTAYQSAGLTGLDGLHARMIACWPFTPEFFDILSKKVPNLGGFQNTRGTLRFLAHVVRATHGQRALVSSQCLPFSDNDVHSALQNLDTSGGEVVRRALGDNYDAVPASLPHRDELFSALVLYSIADPTHPGATLNELLLATLDPDENPLRLRDALAQLKERAFNLHERDERFVFLAVENPHARINAMAGSNLVTGQAVSDHIRDGIFQVWGGRDRTALYVRGDTEGAQRRLRELRSHRLRVLLSTASLSPKERLRLQNLDEERNLIILVEPQVHTSDGEVDYSMFSDEVFLHHARRYEACKLLLEGSPGEVSTKVYRQVRDDEANRLRRAISDRLGVAVAWRRAGATGADVDDSWYELIRLDTPTCAATLQMWRADLSGQPELERVLRERWESFRARTVTEVITWLDRTPGLPMVMDAGWVPSALRRLVAEGALGLIAPDGGPVSAKRATSLTDAELNACTLTDPSAQPPTPPSAEPIVHPRVFGQFDAAKLGVRLQWTYPPLPESGGEFSTLVQRYSSARSWERGKSYNIDANATQDTNRYSGPEAECLDHQQLNPGAWYHYYIFLVYNDGVSPPTYTLSQRLDIPVPKPEASPPGHIESSPCADPHKLLTHVEALVMSGKHMTSESVVRKVEVRVRSVSDAIVAEKLSGRLTERPGLKLEASADLTFVCRGSFNRQEVLAILRLLPKYSGAMYTAVLTLTEDPRPAGGA
jgi:hypothetical protein